MNAYASDDWRIKSGLSVIAGLRWEFFGPYTEKNNRLANLDVAPGYAGVAVVTPGAAGPYTSTSYPAGLIEPRYALFSPRLGVAWKPWKDRQVVIRSGYGIYYTGGVYANFANRLGIEQPFVRAISITTSYADVLSLENGFSTIPSQTIQNTFSVDTEIQTGLRAILEFLGAADHFPNMCCRSDIKARRGRILTFCRAQSRSCGLSPETQQNLAIPMPPLSRMTFPRVIPFTCRADIYPPADGAQPLFQSDLRFLEGHRRHIDSRRRRGSDPKRHSRRTCALELRPAASAYAQLPDSVAGGAGPHFVALARDTRVDLNGDFTAISGSPFTAIVTGDPSGTGIVGGARANQPIAGPVGLRLLQPGRLRCPASGTFGNAGRNTIPGIANFSLNASIFRTFRFPGTA